jgi:hypothetical protein
MVQFKADIDNLRDYTNLEFNKLQESLVKDPLTSIKNEQTGEI